MPRQQNFFQNNKCECRSWTGLWYIFLSLIHHAINWNIVLNVLLAKHGPQKRNGGCTWSILTVRTTGSSFLAIYWRVVSTCTHEAPDLTDRIYLAGILWDQESQMPEAIRTQCMAWFTKLLSAGMVPSILPPIRILQRDTLDKNPLQRCYNRHHARYHNWTVRGPTAYRKFL